KVPAEIRMAYFKDMTKFVATGLTVLGIAHAMGLKVGLNPYSSDFGKVIIGDTHYDIWGGFQQWAVFLMRMIGGKTVNNKGETVKLGEGRNKTRLDVLGHFARSKASPEAGVVTDLLAGKDYNGNDITLGEEVGNLTIPLSPQDATQVAK